MDKLLEIFFKVAEAHPNAPPLTPSRKAFIQSQLSKLAVSCETTPDHPPYSAMIEKALEELNEEKGSTEDSISQFLQESYHNLPLAHPAFLKHHLAKLCESGYIVLLRGKRYMLALENPYLNPSVQVERKPKTRKKQRKHCGVHVIEKYRGPNESKPKLIEYRLRSRGREVEPVRIRRLPSGDPQGGQELRQAHNGSPEESTPESHPELEFVVGENIPGVNSESTHTLRQQSHCGGNKGFSESKSVVTALELHSDSVSPLDQPKIIEPCGSLEADVVEVPRSAVCCSRFKAMNVYSRRKKRNCEQSESVMTDASLNLSPSSNVQESQHPVQDLSPLRRSVRRRTPTRRVIEDLNAKGLSTPHKGSRTFYGCQSEISKRQLVDCELHTDRSELSMQKRTLDHSPVSQFAAGDGVEELKQLRKTDGEIEQVLPQEKKRPRLIIRLAPRPGKMHEGEKACPNSDKGYFSVVLALGHTRSRS